MNCLEPDCGRKPIAQQYCSRHYQWARRHGKIGTKAVPPKATDLERLRHHGWTVTDAGCWEWGGGRYTTGYGQVRTAAGGIGAHRLAYLVWVGPIPEGHVVRHKCDNRPCINPEHLETGTPGDNRQDAVDRNRQARGQNIAQSKLTPDQVREIRRRYSNGGVTQEELGREFGVFQTTVGRIVRGVIWKEEL